MTCMMDMRWLGERRLLALCGVTLPFILLYVLKLSVFSTFLLCSVLVISVFALKNTSSGARRGWISTKPQKQSSGMSGPGEQVHDAAAERATASRNTPRRPHKSGLAPDNKTNRNLSGTSVPHPVISPVISPVTPFERSPLKVVEYHVQRHENRVSGQQAERKQFEPSPFSSDNHAQPESHGMAHLTRSPLSSVRSSLISPVMPVSSVPVNNSFINSSPEHFKHVKPLHKSRLHQPYPNKSLVFPLSNRHYPTHQPEYTRTSMGLLPASSIFYGDGAVRSFSPRKRGGDVRTHSPVTVKIARPDNRRSASPLFRRLSLERNSASPNPLHKDAVIAALNEKRKRIAVDEQDDTSSVASSVGVIAKRRRLDNGSQCSTPSIASSSNFSAAVNSDAPSDGSVDGSVRVRRLWTGRRGVQSRTPRNAIDSSISSSKRAALASEIMRKRMLLQPAEPESSPSKRTSVPFDGLQMTTTPTRGQTLQSTGSNPTADTEGAKQNRDSDSEGPGVIARDQSSSSDGGTPTKVAGRGLLTSRLKTPKPRMIDHQMLQNSSPPGEYTAADLEEDRHLAKQRVNYILASLKDGQEEDEVKDKPKDLQPSTTAGLGALQRPLVSAEPTTSSSTLSSSELLQLSKMKTLPVSAVQKGQLLLPSSKTDTGAAAKDKQPPAYSASAPVTGTKQTGDAAAVKTAAQDVLSKTPSVAGSLPLGGVPKQGGPTAANPTSAAAVGFTVLDSSKSQATGPPSLGQQTSGQLPSKSQVAEKDPMLKELLAGKGLTPATTSAVSQVGLTQPNAILSLATAGKPVGTDQGGLRQAPSGSLGGLLTQGTPVGGFSLAANTVQPQASKDGQGESSTISAGVQQKSTTGSLLFSQALGGGSGLMTSASSNALATSMAPAPSSTSQFGASLAKPAPVSAPSGPTFGSATPNAPSTAQPTFQFGSSTQAPQNNPSTAAQLPSATQAAFSTAITSGIQQGNVPSNSFAILKTEAQSSTPFAFGGTTSAETKTSAAPSFGAPTSIGGQLNTASPAASSGLFGTTPVAPSFAFGSSATTTAAATKPSFTPVFGQAISAAPAQPSTPTFNFSAQPAGATTATSVGPRFKPVFGVPPQTQSSFSQPQSSKPGFQFGSSMTGSANQPTTAASGGFTFNPTPTTTSSLNFGMSATAGASPFQTAASSAATGVFGQQAVSQPPTFGSAAKPANAFGAPSTGQSIFGGQSTAPTPSGGLNFGAQPTSQANPPAFNFGAQQSGQMGSGGVFQFGQQASTGQSASQPMAGFGTPSNSGFNFSAGSSSGFGTPAPSFGGMTPTNPASFSLGTGGSAARRASRLTRQARQRRR